MAKVVYISIGNSDDKLTQAEWSLFCAEVDALMNALDVHGRWFSSPSSRWQNACWCVETHEDQAQIPAVKEHLAMLAGRYRQDSIAWAEAETSFIKASRGGADGE